jgi:hypothetical protein
MALSGDSIAPAQAPLFCRRQYDMAKLHWPVVALQKQRAGRALVAVDCSARDAGYLLVADDRLSVEHYGH